MKQERKKDEAPTAGRVSAAAPPPPSPTPHYDHIFVWMVDTLRAGGARLDFAGIDVYPFRAKKPLVTLALSHGVPTIVQKPFGIDIAQGEDEGLILGAVVALDEMAHDPDEER